MGIKMFKNEKFLLPALVLIVAFFYKGVLGGFFQQDEWFSFTIYLLHKNLSIVDNLKFFFSPNIGHYNPPTVAAQQLLFSLWGMDYIKFAVLGFFLHLIVVLVLYFFAKIVFNGNKILAFATALLFGILASSYQGTAWVVANISTLNSSLLGIVSAIFFSLFLKKRENKYLVWSLISLLVSLLFKESTIGLFPFFFIIYLFQSKRALGEKKLWLIAGTGVAYLSLRVAMFFAPNVGGNELVTQSQPIEKLMYNFATVPLKVLSQALFPAEFIKIVAWQIALIFPEKLTGVVKSPEFEAFVVKRVMEALSVFTGLIVITVATVIRFFSKKIFESRQIIFYGLGWVIANSFIFSFSPEQPSVIFAVDSRNLYFAGVGIAVFTIATLNFFSKKKLTRFFLLLLPVLLFNAYWLNKNLVQFIEKGKTRKYILGEITSKYPNLPPKTIFYTESDTSYYGLPIGEKILPFQSGLGQTILVWYFEREGFPQEFYEGRFLWEISDQGYQEWGNRGFGYFRDSSLLKKTVKEYNLPKDSVIAYKWNSKTNSLTDITEEIRKVL